MEKREKAKKSTKFEKGQSGNPHGRPKMPEWAKEKLSELTPQALERLEKILNARNIAAKDRLTAIKLVLEYGLGKPKQMIDVEASVNNGVTTIKFEGDLADWSK